MAMLLEPGKYPSFKATAAMSKAGLVVKLSREGVVTTTNPGDAPFGVSLKATEDPFHPGTYVANQYVPVAFQGVVALQLLDTNSTVNAGDFLVTDSKGCVAPLNSLPATTISTATSTAAVIDKSVWKKIVGIALEDVASSTGGAVKALLEIPKLYVE